MPDAFSALTPNEQSKRRFDQLKGLFGKYRDNIARNRKFYDLDFESEVMSPAIKARGFSPVIPRTARRAIDEAADHVLFFPKITIPVRPTDSHLVTEQEIAEKKRRAATAWWRQITQRYNPIGDGRKWLFLDGRICIKHTLRLDLLPDKDDPDYRTKLAKMSRNEFMWKHELLNSMWVYEDPADHRNPKYTYVHYHIRTEDAKARWPKAEGEWRNREPYAKINYLEYWSAPKTEEDGTVTPGTYTQWVEEEVVHTSDNPYPYVPIAIEDSGYGLVRGTAEIEDKYRGLIDFSLSVFVAQARQ